MERQRVTGRQAILVLALFMIGNGAILGVDTSARQDSWLALLLAVVAALPLALFYGRIQRLRPGEDLFAIIRELLGPVIGRAVIAIVALYALLVGATTMRSYADFLRIVSMPETPRWPLLLCLMLLALWALRRGLTAFAKTASALGIAVGVLLAAVLVASIGQMEPEHLLPVLGEAQMIPQAAYSNLVFPFGELLIFAALLGSLCPGERAGRVCLGGLLLGGGVLVIETLRSTLVLGTPLMDELFFPSYAANSIVRVGDVLTRVDGLVAAGYIVTGFAKITVCTHVASLGFARLGAREAQPRPMRLLVALVMLLLAQLLYPSIMELYNGMLIYRRWALPLQWILPVLLWLGAEIKYRRRPQALATEESVNPPERPTA